MNNLKQKILITRIRKGDREAFKEIYKIYSDRIYRFIFFRLTSEEEAQDLLQETFLRLWNYLKNKENEIKSLNALTYKIARNLIAEFYRKRDSQISQTIDLEEIEFKLEDQKNINAEKELDIKIDIKLIKSKLENLKNEEYREVIEMKFLDQLSHKEIAEVLEKTEQNVRVILHRAIRKIREEVNE